MISMRKFVFFMIVLLLSPTVGAQYNVYTLALRGGISAYLNDAGHTSIPGPGTLLDLGYTHYWINFQSDMGLHLGISAGYTTCVMVGNIEEHFTNYDYLGNPIQYSVFATVNQSLRQVQMEVPLAFAYRHNHFVMNVGAKLMVNLYSMYNQTLSTSTIDAYFPTWNVHVPNEIITGKANGSTLQLSNSKCQPIFNILATMDFCYEWTFGYEGCAGIGVYVDISPWSNYTAAVQPAQVIEVAPIVDPNNPPAEVTMNPLIQNTCLKMLYADFGVKGYVGINHLQNYRHRRHR